MTSSANPQVLEVGDIVRINIDLIETMREEEKDVLARVTDIERQADGTVVVWFENADAERKES